MPKYCTKCGATLSDCSNFCAQCGAEIKRGGGYSTQNMDETQNNTGSTTPRKPPAIKWSLIIIILLVVIWGVRYFGPKVDKSWAVDKACAEVRS